MTPTLVPYPPLLNLPAGLRRCPRPHPDQKLQKSTKVCGPRPVDSRDGKRARSALCIQHGSPRVLTCVTRNPLRSYCLLQPSHSKHGAVSHITPWVLNTSLPSSSHPLLPAHGVNLSHSSLGASFCNLLRLARATCVVAGLEWFWSLESSRVDMHGKTVISSVYNLSIANNSKG